LRDLAGCIGALAYTYADHLWPIRGFLAESGLDGGAVYIRHGRGKADFIQSGNGDSHFKSALFPIASLSKPITAALIRRLIHDGRISLDTRVSGIIPELDAAHDRRYRTITIQMLLQHTAGFDRGMSGDPLYDTRDGHTYIAGCTRAIEHIVSRPFDHDPGTSIVYDNIGYCMLGVVIECLTHLTYERAVDTYLLEPAGIPAGQLRLGPLQGSHDRCAEAAMDNRHCWYLFKSAGGWQANIASLARLYARDVGSPDIATTPSARFSGSYYGLGWRVWKDDAGHPYYTHFGLLPGVFTLAVARPDGRVAVAFFNGTPHDADAASRQLTAILLRKL